MAKIRFIRPGERVPYGLSTHSSGYRLKFPLWTSYRSGWDPAQDEVVRGKWAFEVCARTEQSGFAMHWGWALVRSVERVA